MYSTIKVRERHPRPHHEGATVFATMDALQSIHFLRVLPIQQYK